MLTHHTVCIRRVDGIITELAKITITPLNYHQPGWTRSRPQKAEYGVHDAITKTNPAVSQTFPTLHAYQRENVEFSMKNHVKMAVIILQ